MAIVNLKSEKRIKQVVTSGGGAENANTYESGDLVYSTSDDTLKQSDATNWKDVPVHPITKLYITANGSTHYVFNGPGFDATANSNTGDRNPTIYLVRGQKYQFENLLGAHPFRISSSDGGGAYTDGITNNDVSNGALEWNVMHDVPNTMYYYCTSHAAMKGEIKIVDASGGSSVTNLGLSNQGASTLTLTSSTGSDIAIPMAGASNNAGLMTDADKDKLDLYPAFTSFNFTSVADTPSAYAGSNADANKFVKVNGDGDGIIFQNVDISPGLMFGTKTLAGSNLAIHSDLNGGDGGTLVVTPQTGQNAGGTATGEGIMVNTGDLTQESKKSRYEILSATSGKGFRFKADTTAIDAFGGGQAQIAAGTGNSDGVSVSDAQKLILLYTGSAWKYMIQSI